MIRGKKRRKTNAYIHIRLGYKGFLFIYKRYFFNFSISCASSQIDNHRNNKETTTEIHSAMPIDEELQCNTDSPYNILTEPGLSVTADTPTSKKLSTLFSSPAATTTSASKKPRFSFPSPSPGKTSETSCYFSQTNSNSGTKEQQHRTSIGKARVSGLKKKNSQPNLLQMWSKMN